MRVSTAAAVGLLGFGAWVFCRVYLYTAESGDSFPEYSSLRSDPKGTKALHDALAELPGMSVERWFKPLSGLKRNDVVLFRLDDPPEQWRLAPFDELKEWEDRARAGLRVFVALRPPQPPPLALGTPKAAADAKPEDAPAVEMLWRLAVTPELKILGGDWRAIREADGKPRFVERAIGKGSIAFAARSFPFSNEGLRDARDSGLIADAVGAYRTVLFDEHRLGVLQGGSVGGLLRKFNLEGAAAVVVLLALLFVWRSTSAFPPRSQGAGPPPVTGRDSAAALANLLRHNIPPGEAPRRRARHLAALGRAVSGSEPGRPPAHRN